MQVRIAAEEDEIKKQYWNILKKKYLNHEQVLNDSKLRRKIRIIKERGTNVQMPQSKVFTWKFYIKLPRDLRQGVILARLPNISPVLNAYSNLYRTVCLYRRGNR